MYIKEQFKKIRGIIPETIASVGTTESFDSTTVNTATLCTPISTNITFGSNFYITLEATTGNIYIYPESTAAEPTSTNSFTLHEGDNIELEVNSFLSLKGDSTTAAFQGIVWEY